MEDLDVYFNKDNKRLLNIHINKLHAGKMRQFTYLETNTKYNLFFNINYI